MSPIPTQTDDTPIDLNADQFTVEEVATLARVSRNLLHAWISRGLAPPGRWYPGPNRTRHLYSIADVLRFVTLQTMCVRHSLCTLAQAALIANIVIDVAKASTAPGANADGIRPNINVLVAWTEDGEMMVTTANIKRPGHYYPPIHVDGKSDPLRAPIIVLPATAMLTDVVLRTSELIDAREEPRARTGVPASA